MSFGTTGVTLSTKITEKEYWTDLNSTRLDADYLHFSTARFWQTVPGK